MSRMKNLPNRRRNVGGPKTQTVKAPASSSVGGVDRRVTRVLANASAATAGALGARRNGSAIGAETTTPGKLTRKRGQLDNDQYVLLLGLLEQYAAGIDPESPTAAAAKLLADRTHADLHVDYQSRPR